MKVLFLFSRPCANTGWLALAWMAVCFHVGTIHADDALANTETETAPAHASKTLERATDFAIDTVHTQIVLRVDHIGFSRSSALLKAKQGQFHLDPENPERSHVQVDIDMNSLDFGDVKWNEKMQGKQFFQVAEFPLARFESRTVKAIDARRFEVQGDLTIRAVTRPVTLQVEQNRLARHPYSLKFTAGFSASASLKRSDFGMDAYLPAIGDTVELRIEVEGNKQ